MEYEAGCVEGVYGGTKQTNTARLPRPVHVVEPVHTSMYLVCTLVQLVWILGNLAFQRSALDMLVHTGAYNPLLCIHGTSFTKKAGNLRRGKVENRQAFVLEQPRLSLLNR